jgi:hypothetical protein
MEAMAKFILFDMLHAIVRDTVTETYFEMEMLERERQ